MNEAQAPAEGHSHIFLGETHAASERRTWTVIWLCGAMMAIEITCGLLFGSIALVADGLHMSTHAGALMLAACAYTFARRHAHDARFSFGTGKVGDLAGFTSAIILGMIAVLIGYDAVSRFFAPVAIDFGQAIPIACLGLLVNLASAWLLGGGHSHAGGHEHTHHGHDQAAGNHDHHHDEEVDKLVGIKQAGDNGAAHRDNNMRAAIVHVIADAAVSILVIVGLILACAFGWTWMDPLAGLIGAVVIASWSYRLIRDTAAILLDINPEPKLADRLRTTVEQDGDRVLDLHLWRLGPGHLGAILSVATTQARGVAYYRDRLARFRSLSHVTVEVEHFLLNPRADGLRRSALYSDGASP